MCALLSGGGYAEKVAVPVGQVLPVPAGVSLKDATAFPEVACTVWSTVFMMGRLSPAESFLVFSLLPVAMTPCICSWQCEKLLSIPLFQCVIAS